MERSAIKYFLQDIKNVTAGTTTKGIQGEISALEKLDEHQNILNYQDWGIHPKTGRFYIVSEWKILGSLSEYIDGGDRKKIPKKLLIILLLMKKLKKKCMSKLKILQQTFG